MTPKALPWWHLYVCYFSGALPTRQTAPELNWPFLVFQMVNSVLFPELWPRHLFHVILLSFLHWTFMFPQSPEVFESWRPEGNVWCRALDSWVGHKHLTFKNGIIAFRKRAPVRPLPLSTTREDTGHRKLAVKQKVGSLGTKSMKLDVELPSI